jgi:hypothetical protein
MGKKTVFRRLSKWLPLSSEFRDALDVDDEPTIDTTTVDLTPKRGQKPQLPAKESTPALTEPKPAEDDLPMESTPVTEAAQEPVEEPKEKAKSPAEAAAPPQAELAERLAKVPFATFVTWALKRNGVAPSGVSPEEVQDASDYCDLAPEVAARILTDTKGLRNVVTIYAPKPD